MSIEDSPLSAEACNARKNSLRPYKLSELRDRASLSADHADGYKTALCNRRWFTECHYLPEAECVSGADADGHTYDAMGNALDGYESISDYSEDDQARLLAMQEGGAK